MKSIYKKYKETPYAFIFRLFNKIRVNSIRICSTLIVRAKLSLMGIKIGKNSIFHGNSSFSGILY